MSGAVGRASRVFVRAALAVALASVTAIGGCTGLEPAAVGATVSAAQTGVTLLSETEVRSFELARFEDVDAAVQNAAGVLALREANEIYAAGQVWRVYRDENGSKVEVLVRTQTARVTSIRITLRSNAQRGLAALLLRAVFHDLRSREAYLEDWTDDADPRLNGVLGEAGVAPRSQDG